MSSLVSHLTPAIIENLRQRHRVKRIITGILDREGFVQVDTPVVGPAVAEYEQTELPVQLPDGRQVYLSQSPQLYKEMLVQAGVDRYYGFANCFRWEILDPKRLDQLRSFTQLDIELATESAEEVRRLVERIVKALCDDFGLPCDTPFRELRALDAIAKYGSDRPAIPVGPGESPFIWIVDWPLLLERSPGVYEPSRHVFALPTTEPSLLRTQQDLRATHVHGYDLVVNGMEVGGGSLRINRGDDLARMVALMGLKMEQFQPLIEMLDSVGRPLGGFAFGFERLVMALTGTADIRSVVAFPDALIAS